MLNQTKGNALESAVQSIESAILRASPGYKDGNFRIEGKKSIESDGVHHEIDLYVKVSLAKEYDALFIFECKNWNTQKVSKNEIVVFSEKIKAANAQKGFFVATSYTKDAIAQAKLDRRMTLLTATELDPTALIVPCGFHAISEEDNVCKATFRKSHIPGAGIEEVVLDTQKQTFSVDGFKTDLSEWLNPIIRRFVEERKNCFPSPLLPEGVHSVEYSGEHVFPAGTAFLNGDELEKVQVSGILAIRITKAVIVSAFDVSTRGRVVSVKLEMPPATIKADFMALHK